MTLVRQSDLPLFARGVLEQIAERSATQKRGREKCAFIVALSGNLGAGKTTFMQALAKELGVVSVVSPTYVLMKSYPISFGVFTKLVHIDAYRLNNSEEFQTLKPEAFLNNPQNLVCVEWPERLAGVLPKPGITLNFSSEGAGEDGRYIEIMSQALRYIVVK